MKLLMNVPSGLRAACGTPDELAMGLFARAKDAYEASASDHTAYLAEAWSAETAAAGLALVDGSARPQEVLDMARNWNQDVAMEFEHALNAAEAQVTCSTDPDKKGARRQWLTCPKPALYRLKVAAMALDGDFYDFADSALLMKDRNHLSVLLKDVELSDIMARPEDYAVIEVTPK